MMSLLCRGRNALVDFSFNYFVYTTFHCTPESKLIYIYIYIYIYHCLNKDYFVDVDAFLKFS